MVTGRGGAPGQAGRQHTEQHPRLEGSATDAPAHERGPLAFSAVDGAAQDVLTVEHVPSRPFASPINNGAPWRPVMESEKKCGRQGAGEAESRTMAACEQLMHRPLLPPRLSTNSASWCAASVR